MSEIKPAKITSVIPESIAAEVGFEAGDAIVSINGIKPRDLIDYQFLCADEILEIEVLDKHGKIHQVEIEKDYDQDLGIEFGTALFDNLIQCNNRCPFCFIDQQPPGKRSSLYLKDDDYRLSFLYGSYLTLTNLPTREWQRIEQMRLSPLYISVHATEPEIRIRLLKNSRAGEILEQIKWFQARRLQIHAQVVVCPGINDGSHLERTLRDLASFYMGEVPTVASVAVVPVGLTRFRPSQDELIPVTREKAREVIGQVEMLGQEFKQKYDSRVVWLADEWFLIGGEELPAQEEYEEYPQIDNGVGSIRLFMKEFNQVANKLLPAKIYPEKTLTWVVGNAVEKAFTPLVDRLNKVEGLRVNMVALYSDYWGQNITVTGLLTGHDLLYHLKGKDLGDGLLLPSIMLKHGELVFLDDMTVAQVSKELDVRILPVAGVEDLIRDLGEVGGNMDHTIANSS
ncbi:MULTISPECIES: TIGR03279 family radical SAM protein [Cylindrospermopsis]|jgi:putative radical SAM enzyme (TIGR03279 family)|uniref:TIGR03279 family radical SAM protein n=1 Tax=Cylindrospermopsis TaxID=77021 RepID=UPI000708966D|nr:MULTISPECIES: TIGR03279 family radical SAM protein [Cylindrospermopsis]KRH98356.1 Fe-S oxidoreductase [Cylindrospermopsis sp. CR12]MBU6345761.1 TIGR03279 family radical SAM protein [Cyanobacteria bacterium REEB494]TPX28967.1 TIGR03279 family radical SAM protein [Cylindrospermopsis raciborskii GIHE 2018]UJS04550.1 TIGR03279 family radical SAM protein [Cylindrospermopsis raciborskii KLL07]